MAGPDMFQIRESGLRNLPICRGSHEQFEDGHEDREAIAASMPSEITLALTLTLIPQESEPPMAAMEKLTRP